MTKHFYTFFNVLSENDKTEFESNYCTNANHAVCFGIDLYFLQSLEDADDDFYHSKL